MSFVLFVRYRVYSSKIILMIGSWRYLYLIFWSYV